MCNQRSEVANQQQPGNVATDGPAEGDQRQQGTSFWSIARDIVVRCVIMYFVVNFFTKMNQPKTAPSSPGVTIEPSTNLFHNGTIMDLYVYINENPSKVDFNSPNELKWTQKELIFGDWNIGPNQEGFVEFDTTIPISKRVQNNGSIYIHVYVTKSGHHPDPKNPTYSEFFTVHQRQQLNKYKKRRYSSTHNLLTGQTSASKESIEKVAQNIKEEIISHWHPNLTINIIYDQTPWVQGRVPSPFDQYIRFDITTGKYFPVIYLNDYWNLQRDYQPINSTLESIPLHLTFQPLSMFRWQLYITQNMRSQWNSILGADMMEESDSSQDSVKEALLETSPILLALTIIVSITHSIFEFLAFKNDIQFWRNRESLEGLSVRSVFFNVFQSVVVFLYVLDNDTNTVVRISIGIGLLIEIWKIPKVTNIEIDYQNKIFNIIPRIKIADKGSYVESSTRQYDVLAFKYLSWIVFPLFVGYSVYSLLYEEHKGWYSWVLGMVYGFLLTFGFISMTPQLFINYKLKSVAHLPWRMLTYKFLNTFIDDIFAFVIKMPTMYRIGCFRDDIIFLIYLYQRWIYRVDPKRVNEFGVSGEVLDKSKDEKDKPMAAIKDKDDRASNEETKKDQ
ncbi:cleft lip and palate transmembrane protein 1 homolog [Tetranychus urticae]|uniref:Cleft lip and palate transmembrane protein 1 n=1 Tax=Tetranychus urticae TaxID=32264 RepID=T1JTL4_TETUR|nr:cleft lip and palate transmembrane protein 1 homolog [Tetranychus urticae]